MVHDFLSDLITTLTYLLMDNFCPCLMYRFIYQTRSELMSKHVEKIKEQGLVLDLANIIGNPKIYNFPFLKYFPIFVLCLSVLCFVSRFKSNYYILFYFLLLHLRTIKMDNYFCCRNRWKINTEKKSWTIVQIQHKI